MKKILALILVLTMIVLPIMSCDSGTPNETDTDTQTPETDTPETDTPVIDAPSLRPEDEELYVGYARECITPYDENGNLLPDIQLTGYAGSKIAKSVKDDIYASCTAIRDDEGNTTLIYSLDLHAMTVEFAKSIQKTLERELGVPEDYIILNVTHTHAAPETSLIGNIVKDKALTAAKAAIDDLTLVTELYTGTIDVPNMNFIRRYKEENGKAVAHLWDNDPTMPVVRFVREGAKKDVIIANWAAHCDTVHGTNDTTISADYVSYFRRRVESDLDAYVSLHMAASGDVNPLGRVSGEPTFPGTVRYGEQLAAKLINNLETLKKCEIKSEVKALFERVKVEYDHSDDAEHGPQAKEIMDRYFAGEGLSAEIQALVKEYGFASIYDAMYTNARYKAGVSNRLNVGAISIGNVVFAVAPYEIFTVNGKAIKDSADEFDGAIMCAYSNGMIGYIASEEAFNYDIYEVQSRLYVKGTAEILQNVIIEKIDELGK